MAFLRAWGLPLEAQPGSLPATESSPTRHGRGSTGDQSMGDNYSSGFALFAVTACPNSDTASRCERAAANVAHDART